MKVQLKITELLAHCYSFLFLSCNKGQNQQRKSSIRDEAKYHHSNLAPDRGHSAPSFLPSIFCFCVFFLHLGGRKRCLFAFNLPDDRNTCLQIRFPSSDMDNKEPGQHVPNYLPAEWWCHRKTQCVRTRRCLPCDQEGARRNCFTVSGGQRREAFINLHIVV